MIEKVCSINELKKGVEYKTESGHFYKINEFGVLEFSGNRTGWHSSDLPYNYLLKMHFEEQEEVVDWSKVDVDTKILVSEFECSILHNRHFAKFENGKVYCFRDGKTSFTTEGIDLFNSFTEWNYAKLYKEEEDGEV